MVWTPVARVYLAAQVDLKFDSVLLVARIEIVSSIEFI